LGEISLGLFNFGPKILIAFYGLNVLHRPAADRYLVLGGVNVGQLILEGNFLKNLGVAVLVKLIGNGLGKTKFASSPDRRSKEREKKKKEKKKRHKLRY
jgi:dihydrofolate reductase